MANFDREKLNKVGSIAWTIAKIGLGIYLGLLVTSILNALGFYWFFSDNIQSFGVDYYFARPMALGLAVLYGYTIHWIFRRLILLDRRWLLGAGGLIGVWFLLTAVLHMPYKDKSFDPTNGEPQQMYLKLPNGEYKFFPKGLKYDPDTGKELKEFDSNTADELEKTRLKKQEESNRLEMERLFQVEKSRLEAERVAKAEAARVVAERARDVESQRQNKEREEQAIQPDGQKRKALNPKDGLIYVWIPPGKFRMGCSPDDGECEDNEKSTHQVVISQGFRMGQTEVTKGAYRRVVGDLPKPEEFGYPPTSLQRKFDQLTGVKPGFTPDDNFPVSLIHWNQANKYCELIGMRLPTEIEWEYSARGGTTGSRYGNLGNIAWYSSENNKYGTHEVGQKEPNAYGLFDMLGNVGELTDNDYRNGLRPSDWGYGEKAVRGGSYFDNASGIRVSRRYGYNADLGIGFRCAK